MIRDYRFGWTEPSGRLCYFNFILRDTSLLFKSQNISFVDQKFFIKIISGYFSYDEGPFTYGQCVYIDGEVSFIAKFWKYVEIIFSSDGKSGKYG